MFKCREKGRWALAALTLCLTLGWGNHAAVADATGCRPIGGTTEVNLGGYHIPTRTRIRNLDPGDLNDVTAPPTNAL